VSDAVRPQGPDADAAPGVAAGAAPAAGPAPQRQARVQARAQALAYAAVAGALAAWLGGSALMLWATLGPDERARAAALLAPRGALLLLAGLAGAAALAAVLPRWWRRYVVAPATLLGDARVLLATDAQRTLAAPDGGAALQGLADAFNQLAAQRRALQADIAAQVQAASRGVAQERNRLAALMAELTQAVVVCNLDGRILLYNAQARAIFRALAGAPALGEGVSLIGIGRSVYQVLDRALVAHALERVQRELQRGAAQPAAHFLTAGAGGQLLRVQMAPVLGVAEAEAVARGDREAAASPAAPALTGFVLMLADITREFEAANAQDQLLLELTERSRSSLGNLQAALEMLDFPDLAPAQRERFLGVVRDEAGAMVRRVNALAERTAQGQATRWPLEEMLGADLVAAAQRRIAALDPAATGGAPLRVAQDAVDPALWLQVDSFSLLQALAYLAARLADEHAVRLVRLRLAPASGRVRTHAQLDLVWVGPGMSTETVLGWETDPMRVGAQASPLSVRDVAERHGGEFWFERERVRHEAFFRFLLPLAEAQPTLPADATLQHDSRPVYYDFDLFQASEAGRALDERPLAELAYTVFDTETTGLEPAQGDEIIQIGATRVVAGKLRRQDSFEQLVDPQRALPAAGIAIHGIQPEMLRGQPTIATVLPAFHAFAQDTVLVAHNAAFDLRFLQLKEAATGLRFDQPVLDTLLLSAVVHPQAESHRLEDIAARLGIAVLGRHTALGDAIVTAEVLLQLIPLLAAMGIHTLGQARQASQQTWYARLNY